MIFRGIYLAFNKCFNNDDDDNGDDDIDLSTCVSNVGDMCG